MTLARTERARLARALALFMLAWTLARAATASSIQVDPIRVDLGPNATSATLVVRNAGAAPVVIQADLHDWSVDERGEHHRPTRALVVAPTVMTVPPGGEQVVRLGLRSPPVRTEQAYRLFMTEVPPPPKPGFRGLQVALRVGVPVFVAPAAPKAAPRLAWDATRPAADTLVVVAANDGARHVRIQSLEAFVPGTTTPFATQGLAYVLAGSRRAFTLPLPAGFSAGRVTVKLTTDDGPLESEVAVPPR